jgi:hypothetical protein
MRRWRDAEALPYNGAPHGALGPLCKWDARPQSALRVVPLPALRRVCAVIPHVPQGAVVTPRDVSAVEYWWVNVHNLDRAGPARGLDWRAGIPPEARVRPAPVLEEMCEHCHGVDSVPNNKMYLCEVEGCLNGWHRACLLADGRRPPRRNAPFYCNTHEAIPVN